MHEVSKDASVARLVCLCALGQIAIYSLIFNFSSFYVISFDVKSNLRGFEGKQVYEMNVFLGIHFILLHKI